MYVICLLISPLNGLEVLEENPFAVDPSQLSEISILQTYVGGRNVYKTS